MQANSLPSGVFRPALPASHQIRYVLTQIADIFSAIGEGVQNARDYQDLTNQGVAPRDAVRRVFETIRK